MSASGTPDPNLPHKYPIRPDSSSATPLQHLPPDPLLEAGSFIDSSLAGTLAGARNSGGDLHRSAKMADTLDRRRSSLGETLNGKKLPASVHGARNGGSPKKCSIPKSNDASPKTVSSEKPNWLPSNWVVQDKVRSSGATAGTVDRYYFDPASGRRFRSKLEVLYFLETGTLRKRKKTSDDHTTPGDNSEEHKNKKTSSSSKTSVLNFDFSNVPEKVEWILTEPSQECWTPVIDNEKVSDSIKREWVAAFHHLCHSKV